MGPISTSMVAGYLGKLGAGIAVGQFKKLLANKSQRRVIARKAAKAASTEGISVKPAVLREWLSRSDVQEQLILGSHESIETAVKRLAWALAGPDDDRDERALRLVEITCRQYLLVQSPQEASAISAAQTQALTLAESQATREEFSRGIATLVDQLDASAVFEEDLRRLHTWRAAEAEELAGSWPKIHEVVHLLALSRDRGALLDCWVSQTPGVLADAPGPVWCWIGQVAKDYDHHEAAIAFMVRGIDRGVPDPDYWWARAALASPGQEDGVEQTRRDLLARAREPHPLGRALLAFLTEKWTEVEEALEAWDATAGNDRAIKVLLGAECARAQSQLDVAISLLQQGCAEEPEASGPMLHLAELLLARGYRGHTISRIADFTQAQALAVRARDARRQWGGDSVAAALVAVKASALAGDLNRTWEFTQVDPDGDASAVEAADPRLRREAAVLAAMTMRTEVADQLAAELDDPYTLELVAGYQALNREDFDTAESHWLAAWTHAGDSFARLQVARSLAPLGLRLPDLEDLANEQPDMVAEIRAIHDVMTTGSGQRLAKLRAHAYEFEQIAVLLAQELSAQGQQLGAAEVLLEAAKRWDQPLLMKMTADRFFHAGEYERSVDACRHAYAMAGAGWPAEFECRAIEFNALEALGREDESIFVIRRMTALAPDNDDARWALVHCLGRQGNTEAAFAALRHNGRPIRPRTREEARNWIVLLTQADHSPHYLPRVLDELARWRDDEEVAGVFLANVTIGLGQRDSDPDEAQLGRLRASTEEYVDRFPKSQLFRRFTISEDDPLGDLATILRTRGTDPVLQDLQAKVANAKLPLGLASEVHNLSYAEASLKRVSGFVYSNVPGATAADLAGLLEAIGTAPAVLDTTAGVTLLALDQELRTHLLGRFSRVESTGAAFRDARAAQQSLGMRSTMSLGWDSSRDRARIDEVSAEEADGLAKRADGLVQLLTGTSRRDWQLQHFTELNMQGAWLNAVDYAVANNRPFWCDDLALRGLARQAGCTAFGTVDLICALESAGDVDSEVARSAKARLLTEFHVALDFDPDLYELAAQMDEWQARGVAATLALPDTWRSPLAVMKFVHLAARHNAESSQHDLRGWVGAAAVGLVKLGSDAAGASHNLALLLGSFLSLPWMTPALLPVVVEGVRQAVGQSEGVADPLHEMLVLIHRMASQEFGDSAAAYVLLHWAEYLDKSDKHDATMIAATGRG